MVPKDRIELSADPYQGPVLPLNYIGKSIKIISKKKKEVNYFSPFLAIEPVEKNFFFSLITSLL